MIVYSAKAHGELIAGSRKAIAWGASADAHLKIIKSPYIFECIVDNNVAKEKRCIRNVPVLSTDILKNKSTEEYVIVVFADVAHFADIIAKQAQSYGPFLVVPPFCPWKQYGTEKMLREFDQFIAPHLDSRSFFQDRGSSKNIALFVGKLSRGGAEKQMVLLALALAKQQYQVCLYSAQPDADDLGDWHDLLIESGVERQTLASLNQTKKDFDCSHKEQLITIFSTYATHVIGQLTLALRVNKPAILISYMPSNCLIALIAGLLSGIERISLSFRNVAPSNKSDDDYAFATLGVARNALPNLLSLGLSISGVTLTHNSQHGRTSYAKWMDVPEQKMQVVHNGMLPIEYSNRDIATMFSIKQNSTVIVGVMRLVEQKRPKLFLDVIEILHSQIDNLRVFLIGDGPLYKNLENQILKQGLGNVVEMVGNDYFPADYMRVADALLHTALIEGFPNVLLEAQAVGCPFVATDAGGSKETVIERLREQCICENDNPNALAQRIINILNDEFRLDFKRLGRQIERKHSLANLAKNTINASFDGVTQ